MLGWTPDLRTTTSGLLMLALWACNGPQGVSPMPDAGQANDAGLIADAGALDAGHPEDLIVTVPDGLETLPVNRTCAALSPTERVLGVSPEGHLWLGQTSSVSTSVRVLDGWDAGYEGHYQLAAGGLVGVQAWTATAASFVAEGRLFHAVDGLRTAISLTATLTPDATLCGDITAGAFVYSDGALYEREGDAWLQWTGVQAALQPDAQLLARDGECFGADDGVWFASTTPAGELELWQLLGSEIRRPAILMQGTQPGLLNDAVLALREGHLFVGPTWTEFAFDAGDATQMAMAGQYAWLRVGSQILRFDGTTFMEAGTSTGAAQLYPHAAGGLWVTEGGQACHWAPEGMLQVKGLRTGTRSKAAAISLRVRASQDSGPVQAMVDGVALTPTAQREGWSIFSAGLEVGWHTVALSTEAGQVSRNLSVKRVPAIERSFAADVQPIFNTHCVACHVSGNAFGAPDLSSLESWTERAQRIRERVVQGGDMPPPASRDASWGDEQVTVINEWLSGGMNP